MKILTVLSTFPPHFYGGGEISAINLSKWLAKQGHEVGVITAADKNGSELYGEMVDGLRIWRLRFPRPYPFWNHTKSSKWLKPLWYLQDHFDFRNRTLMRRALSQFKPDVVNIHVISGIGYNSLREIGQLKIPTVYFLHDLSLACLWGGMFKDKKICTKQCFECRVASHIRFADVSSIPNIAFCSPSRANLDKIASVLPLKNHTTATIFNPNKYPAPTVPLRSKADHVRFLYVGRIDKTKGIDFLLSILENLSQKYRFTIDLLGEGMEYAVLRKRFERHRWCRFRGQVSQGEVSNYMNQSDVLCTPSIWPENLPGVVVQAMEIGLPVLGSDIGGIPELIDHGKNGLLIPANQPIAWTKAIETILDNPAQLEVWGIYAKTNAAKFDQDVNGHKVLALFEEVVATAEKGNGIAGVAS